MILVRMQSLLLTRDGSFIYSRLECLCARLAGKPSLQHSNTPADRHHESYCTGKLRGLANGSKPVEELEQSAALEPLQCDDTLGKPGLESYDHARYSFENFVRSARQPPGHAASLSSS